MRTTAVNNLDHPAKAKQRVKAVFAFGTGTKAVAKAVHQRRIEPHAMRCGPGLDCWGERRAIGLPSFAHPGPENDTDMLVGFCRVGFRNRQAR